MHMLQHFCITLSSFFSIFFATLYLLDARFLFNDERIQCSYQPCTKEIPMIRILSSYYSIYFIFFSSCILLLHTKCMKEEVKKIVFFYNLDCDYIATVVFISVRYLCLLNKKQFLRTRRFQQALQFHTISITLNLCLYVSRVVPSKFDCIKYILSGFIGMQNLYFSTFNGFL